MIIQQKLGNLDSFPVNNRAKDLIRLEWYETGKRILHKRTQSGKEIIFKFLKESPALTQDDVIYETADYLVVIDIQPCEVIVVSPGSLYEAASLCYEIGNKHLPLFFEENDLLVPFDAPLFRLLTAAGFKPRQEFRKLLHPLKTTVSPHGPGMQSVSLFSRILQLTTPSPDA